MKGHTLDYIIIAAYLIGIAIFGIVSGGKQKSIKDYFLGSNSVPWWAVCFSIVAAETSTLTFISIPGLAYLTNLNFLQVTFGYLIGRIIVAVFFLPAYYKGNLKTAYSYLESRFGGKTRSFASIVFLFTRTAADGVRLAATAIPLYLMLGINQTAAIIIIAAVGKEGGRRGKRRKKGREKKERKKREEGEREKKKSRRKKKEREQQRKQRAGGAKKEDYLLIIKAILKQHIPI